MKKVTTQNKTDLHKDRIYVCHTYYHVYVACLKEFYLPKDKQGRASLVLSTMSNDFGNLKDRAEKCGLFEAVYLFEEKEDVFFPRLQKYHKDRGNIVINMLARIRYTKMLGKLQEPYVPVDFREYKDIYVFCDSDPIGYYLNYKKIFYHAVEDGLNCIQHFDTARYANRGHFELKAWMSAHNLIFIQNGYGKYCLDMELNDKSVVPYPCDKYIEQPRAELVEHLSEADRKVLLRLFIEDIDELQRKLDCGAKDKILVLSEPLCSLDVRKQIFSDIIEEYGEVDGCKGQILIKPHPRDVLDYGKEFPEHIVLNGMFPMELLNFIPGLHFKRVITVFTVLDSIHFAEERIFLGKDFMDKYEAPELHRQDEMI
ncbi:MAG: glycosyltransferase family 52 protein [Lachnospiraceae bacterium]|nr:glycosyltransferase family 52 protein [Lachnospiraceae bacterium]